MTAQLRTPGPQTTTSAAGHSIDQIWSWHHRRGGRRAIRGRGSPGSAADRSASPPLAPLYLPPEDITAAWYHRRRRRSSRRTSPGLWSGQSSLPPSAGSPGTPSLHRRPSAAAAGRLPCTRQGHRALYSVHRAHDVSPVHCAACRTLTLHWAHHTAASAGRAGTPCRQDGQCAIKSTVAKVEDLGGK